MNFKRLLGKLAFASFLAVQGITAQEKAPEQEVEERFLVLGSIIPENGTLLTGSSARLTYDDMNRHQSGDINRMLRQIPGVYVREEDGYGLFPNIALRGVNSHRSTKITLMEDGITSAPAPYSEPSAYYSPNAARMNGIEVIKGSASVKYGPNTSGGVVNYISTPIPTEETFYLKQLFGNYGEARTHSYYGNAIDLEAGRFSFLLEGFYRENDGFRDIQGSSNETGIENQFEPMLKLRFEPKTAQYQFFEFKIGYSDTDSNLTYAGLERDDFNNDSYDRYWGTQWAFMDQESTRTYLRHYVELDDTTTLTNTIYYNRFTRNWYKNSGSDDAAFQGTGTGNVIYKNNNRDYYQAGWMTDLTKEIDNHTISIGTKFHHDRYDDDSWKNTYTIGAPRTVTAFSRGSKSANAQYMYTDAFSAYIQDEIAINDKLTITPGVRYEHIRYDHSKSDVHDRSDVDIWLPGIGFAYDFNANWQMFGGIHKAASVPTAEDHAKDVATYERSINYELGLRHFSDDASYGGEAVVFFNDIEDVYDGKSIASGNTTAGGNVGDSETYGLELSGFADLGKLNDWDFQNPWRFAFTYTHAEITDVNEGYTKGTNGFYTGAEDGNDIPYIPEFQYSIGTGIHFKKFGFDVDLVFVDESYVTGDNTDQIDAHATVDISSYYKVNENFTIVASVLNVFDEEYEAGHHPDEIRAGAPMTFTAGFEVKF